MELSQDHKPAREDERQRVEQSSAVLLSERQIRGSGDHSKIYVCRERGGTIVYGVLFTRSVGDLDAHTHLGVSTKPEIKRHPLPPGRCFLVLASDGLWDHMSSREVAEFVGKVDDPQTAAASLTERAKDLWDIRDHDLRRDDITIVVARLDARAQGAEGAEEGGGEGSVAQAAQAEPASEEATSPGPPSEGSGSAQAAPPHAEEAEAGAGADDAAQPGSPPLEGARA